MGAGGTKSSVEDTMVWMMPLYYTKEEITEGDVENCKLVWDGIIHDSLPNFLATTGTPGFAFESCRAWFYHTFYNRLMETQPHTRGLFVNGVDTVGVFMVKMISMCLTSLQKKTEFENTLKALALRHCQRGIQVNEYFFFGDVLFYSIRLVAGDAYTPEIDSSWKRMYSSMLSIIVPECLRFGLALMKDGTTNGNIALREKQENQQSLSQPEGSGPNDPGPLSKAVSEAKVAHP
jgi:hemoglobin-like flavoprotein